MTWVMADVRDNSKDPAVTYLHGDLIGSTMLLTDESGQVADPGAWSYAAFGDNGGAARSRAGVPPFGTATPAGTGTRPGC